MAEGTITRQRTLTFSARSDAEALTLALSRMRGEFPAERGWTTTARIIKDPTRPNRTYRTVVVTGKLEPQGVVA